MIQVQNFQVAIKALVVHAGGLLLVREREGHLWELPGGRIDVGEEALDHREVLRRELREELGADFACRIGEPVVSWVRAPRRPGAPFVFLLGFRCDAASGAIALSQEHDAWCYAGPDDWRDLALAPGYARALAEFAAPRAVGD